AGGSRPAAMMAEPRLRVLVVDDHDVVHWGFRLLLERQPWVERCVVAPGGKEAMEQARHLKPDVALIDLLLRDESGAELCEELHEALPETRILLLSGVGSISPAVARRAGASGFVSKDLGAGDIVKAVRMVALGMEVFGRGEEEPGPLSGREREVVGLIASGATNREIAQRLYLSPHTVKEHTSAIYRKLGVRNRAEAVKRAQRLGIIA
ncbi:MAG: response regulator, partial [Solirubrobacterales bacterium]